jgi:hypothetical protein
MIAVSRESGEVCVVRADVQVGGSIGTGLFVASGGALRRGGPAGVLIAWSIIGVMLINVSIASRIPPS